jgi:hypothetical protein
VATTNYCTYVASEVRQRSGSRSRIGFHAMRLVMETTPTLYAIRTQPRHQAALRLGWSIAEAIRCPVNQNLDHREGVVKILQD